MSHVFREYLQKIGSGVHTGKNLSREESAEAMTMILEGTATPAQIGAFMIAHRIKRPSPEELAGILDAFDRLGPKLDAIDLPDDRAVAVLGTPYDGRSRTVPVTPITSLILATAGIPTILHGGDTMPTKYGVPLSQWFRTLGLDVSQLSLAQNQRLFQATGWAFIYLPNHFPLAQDLVPYRDQLGKRPPIASAELVWQPYRGRSRIFAGYVHPPSEERFRETFALRGQTGLTTIKGLEGSCDLPCSRTTIVGSSRNLGNTEWERLAIHPEEYGLSGKDMALDSFSKALAEIKAVIDGKQSALLDAALLNGGCYLWHGGAATDLAEGLVLARDLLSSGRVAQKLEQIIDLSRDRVFTN